MFFFSPLIGPQNTAETSDAGGWRGFTCMHVCILTRQHWLLTETLFGRLVQQRMQLSFKSDPCVYVCVCDLQFAVQFAAICRVHPIFETSCFIFHIYTHTNTDACMQNTFCWCAEERKSVVFLIQSLGNWSAPHGTVVQRKRQKARDTPRPKVET